ncbi:MAG TPA: ATP-binding cassette domain-containing protein, partial [Burkholderiales bacterium]|nr:ATP-binding cassette domain-containing protein [Burkholderiales bacterium]
MSVGSSAVVSAGLDDSSLLLLIPIASSAPTKYCVVRIIGPPGGKRGTFHAKPRAPGGRFRGIDNTRRHAVKRRPDITLCIAVEIRVSTGNVLAEVSHLSRYYGGLRAVNDVSFTVRQGEILGFLGPNGAGKTTTMQL